MPERNSSSGICYFGAAIAIRILFFLFVGTIIKLQALALLNDSLVLVKTFQIIFQNKIT